MEGRVLSLPPLVNASFLSHHVFPTKNVPNNFALKGVAKLNMTKECGNEEEKRIKVSFGSTGSRLHCSPWRYPDSCCRFPSQESSLLFFFPEEIRKVLK